VKGKLKRVSSAGGSVEGLCDLPSGAAIDSVNARGDILFFAGQQPIHSISTADCKITTVAPWDKQRYGLGEYFGRFLPDGVHFLYAALSPSRKHDIYAGSLDGKAGRLLVHNASDPSYAEGFLVFARDGYLFAQAFDADALKASGDPVALMPQQVAFFGLGAVANYAAAARSLVYQEQVVAPLELSWNDWHGNRLEQLLPPGNWVSNARISPDGTKILVSQGDPQTHLGDLWMIDSSRKVTTKVTNDSPAGSINGPLWSPDGKRIAFSAAIEHPPLLTMYVQEADGSRKLLPSPREDADYIPTDWSPDGKFLLCAEVPLDDSPPKLLLYPLNDNGKPRSIATNIFSDGESRISPDGSWVSYVSDASGRHEVYLQSLADPSQKVQISTEGGRSPRWSPDGKQLFYLTLDARLMRVSFRGNPLRPNPAQFLFPLPPSSDEGPTVYEIPPDGKRLLIEAPVGRVTAPLTVVLNWQTELKK
jgi:WD40 repeat protein